MKRLRFGAGLLALLLAVSLYLGEALTELTRPGAADLDKAAVAALEDNWPLASALYLRAQQHWEEHRNLAAVLARHDPIEQIDAAFAALPAYAATEDRSGFCTACGQLAQQLRALPLPHSTEWWNLL